VVKDAIQFYQHVGGLVSINTIITSVADPRSRVLMVMCQIARTIRATRNQGYKLPDTPGVID
jgi:hypothetical protein